VGFLGVAEGGGGVFEGLPGMFVTGEMIFFAVMSGRNAMSVSGPFVKFRGSLMRILGHSGAFSILFQGVGL